MVCHWPTLTGSHFVPFDMIHAESSTECLAIFTLDRVTGVPSSRFESHLETPSIGNPAETQSHLRPPRRIRDYSFGLPINVFCARALLAGSGPVSTCQRRSLVGQCVSNMEMLPVRANARVPAAANKHCRGRLGKNDSRTPL